MITGERLKTFYWGMMGMFLGSAIIEFANDIRLSNPLLWREFQIVTREGINGYFSMFGLLFLAGFLIILVLYLFTFRKKKFEEQQ